PPDRSLYDFVYPSEVVLIGRLLIALLSTATVLVVGALARRLGGPAAGLIAALFAALCPALVSRGSIVIVDTTAAFCVAGALFLADVVAEEADAGPRLRRFAFLAGAASGLAATAKYTLATVLAAVLVAIWLRPEDARRKRALTLLAGAGFLL